MTILFASRDWVATVSCVCSSRDTIATGKTCVSCANMESAFFIKLDLEGPMSSSLAETVFFASRNCVASW